MSQGMSKARQAWVSQRDGTVTYLKLQLQPPIRCRLPQGYRERLIPQMNEMRNTALLYTHRWQALTLIMRARSGSGLPVLVPAILLGGQQKMWDGSACVLSKSRSQMRGLLCPDLGIFGGWIFVAKLSLFGDQTRERRLPPTLTAQPVLAWPI